MFSEYGDVKKIDQDDLNNSMYSGGDVLHGVTSEVQSDYEMYEPEPSQIKKVQNPNSYVPPLNIPQNKYETKLEVFDENEEENESDDENKIIRGKEFNNEYDDLLAAS